WLLNPYTGNPRPNRTRRPVLRPVLGRAPSCGYTGAKARHLIVQFSGERLMVSPRNFDPLLRPPVRAWLAMTLLSGLLPACSGQLVIEQPLEVVDVCSTSAECGVERLCNVEEGVCEESDGPCSQDFPTGDCPSGRI